MFLTQEFGRTHDVAELVADRPADATRSAAADTAPTKLRDPAERNRSLRLFYRGWRPSRLGKLVNRMWAWLSGLGLTPQILLTLQVKGRSSSCLRANVLVPVTYGGQHYVVSMLRPASRKFRALSDNSPVGPRTSEILVLATAPTGCATCARRAERRSSNEAGRARSCSRRSHLESGRPASRRTARSPQAATTISRSRTPPRSPSSRRSPRTTRCSASTGGWSRRSPTDNELAGL